MARKYVRTDKNGTKIYHDNTCTRCGGRGYGGWYVDGGICWECGGSGVSKARVIKEYTPEYRAKLDENARKREVKRQEKYMADKMEKASEEDKKFLEENFFGADFIFIIKGNTYNVKEALKEEGCKFRNGIAWYTKETTRPAWKISVEDLTELDQFGIHTWKSNEFYINFMKELQRSELRDSNWQFNANERVEIKLRVIASIRMERERMAFYDDGISYLNKMEDVNGNEFIWKTGRPLSGDVTLKATIKEHTEYNGRKQTVLTRCKVVEKEITEVNNNQEEARVQGTFDMSVLDNFYKE